MDSCFILWNITHFHHSDLIVKFTRFDQLETFQAGCFFWCVPVIILYQSGFSRETDQSHVCACMYTHVCVCVHIYIYIYICIFVCVFLYMCVCRHTQWKCVNEPTRLSKIYFKEVAYTFMDSGKSKVCMAGQLGTQRRIDAAVQVQTLSTAEPLLPERSVCFYWDFHLAGWDLFTLWRVICFTQRFLI